VNYPAAKKLAVAARADLNPVIRNGTSVNFRISGGIKLHL
jgi:hypothetical protein